MLFSQWITLTEDSPKAPVGGIRLEDVGLCGVSDLQDWCAREVTLKSLESSFLVVTPVHLVGLTLSGEVSQGCCNCRKTRNESVVVANKTQEGPDVGLRYRSGELSNSLHFARIWLDDPPTDDVSEIGNLDSPKAALTELQSQPSDVKTTEHLPEVSTVFFPVLTEYRDIQVRTEKLLAVSDYTSDHSLECRQSTVKTKGHDFKFEQAKWCSEGGLITGLGIHRDLPVALAGSSMVTTAEVPMLSNTSSTSGMGYASNLATWLSLRKSTQNLIPPSFFSTNTMGEAQGLVDGPITPDANISSSSLFTIFRPEYGILYGL